MSSTKVTSASLGCFFYTVSAIIGPTDSNQMSSVISKSAAVLFDMDGLLFDTERTLKNIWQNEARLLGYDLNDTLYARLVGVPNALCEVLLTQWFPGFPLVEFRRRWKDQREQEHNVSPVPPMPGAIEIISWLHAQGILLALATSSSVHAVERNRRAFPDLFRFSAVVTIEDVARPKPAPDIYRQACQRLGVLPNSCVIFEDSNPGMRAAIASGARSVMIPDLTAPEPDVIAGAFRVYSSLPVAMDCSREWL